MRARSRPSVCADANLQRMMAHASGYIDALDVHELLDPVVRELAPVTALFYSAEREPNIGPHDLIDKDGTALDAFACNALTAFAIAREDSAAKTENGIEI